MYSKVLVALDGSKLSEAILPHARTLAEKLAVPVELLEVIDYDTLMPDNVDPKQDAMVAQQKTKILESQQPRRDVSRTIMDGLRGRGRPSGRGDCRSCRRRAGHARCDDHARPFGNSALGTGQRGGKSSARVSQPFAAVPECRADNAGTRGAVEIDPCSVGRLRARRDRSRARGGALPKARPRADSRARFQSPEPVLRRDLHAGRAHLGADSGRNAELSRRQGERAQGPRDSQDLRGRSEEHTSE